MRPRFLLAVAFCLAVLIGGIAFLRRPHTDVNQPPSLVEAPAEPASEDPIPTTPAASPGATVVESPVAPVLDDGEATLSGIKVVFKN